MGIFLIVFLILIFIACVGVIGTDGLWHSLLTLFNVLTAAVLATNYFEPASTWLDSKMPTYSYLVDIIVLWGLFAIFFIVFRVLTGFASRIKVRFIKPVDLAGGMLLSLWIAWILVCLTMTSLHVAPLPKNSFGGTFQPEPDTRMFFGLAPDRKWLAFMHKVSKGSFRKSPPADEPDKYVFDPEAKFILTYAERRAIFETTEELRVRRQFGSGKVQE